MMTIVDSGGANISSILFALDRIEVKAELTADVDKIAKASRVILPGVGAAGEAMETLQARGLQDCISALTCPVMGICLGMQMLFSTSEEGNANLLDIIKAPVRKFKEEPQKTIPHIGWNTIEFAMPDNLLLCGVNNGAHFYFVHSYFAPSGDYTVATCDYCADSFSAIIVQDNFMGCQFHPERSGAAGSKILENFTRL